MNRNSIVHRVGASLQEMFDETRTTLYNPKVYAGIDEFTIEAAYIGPFLESYFSETTVKWILADLHEDAMRYIKESGIEELPIVTMVEYRPCISEAAINVEIVISLDPYMIMDNNEITNQNLDRLMDALTA